ncbi:MAG: hypothetical protein DRN96_06330 [Thermoproteota archaeon]|nr:MAG: hypothetical protein DRN96_06330 [Candidatus Korarchaeota archaeon]RLG54683.1 MAG: hypothetical protein DRN99_04650 [Candidatus Korarchaeota archaeon]
MDIVVDAMLAHIARWLRMLGVSTIVLDREDEEILEYSVTHNSILITMDKGLFKKATKLGVPAALLKTHIVEEVLAFLSYHLKISLSFPPDNTRCPICNAVLEKMGSRWRCQKCGKEYWIGSHYPSILRKLERARALSKSSSIQRYGILNTPYSLTSLDDTSAAHSSHR